MNQEEKRISLIKYLLDENPEYRNINIPSSDENQKDLLRSLMNIRLPKEIDKNILKIQDEYLRDAIKKKGITDIKNLTEIKKDIYLWQGDITTLKVDAIVNAANDQMTGCYYPCHKCIDNAIHTFAGMQLRLKCAKMMKNKRREETGSAEITNAYNLPAKYIIHTVGPIIYSKVTKKEEEQLASCYNSCLELAAKHNLNSIAFCCISTGEFSFPPSLAAKIAIQTVSSYKEKTNNKIKVIFNVFKESDYEIYNKLLRTN